MRIRVSNRLALLAAVGVVVTSLGVARTPVYALQPHVLTADNFTSVAAEGFGDFQNSWAWSAAWFNNKLYVGTNRNYDCASQAMLNAIPIIGLFFPYPPTVPMSTTDPSVSSVTCPSGGLLNQVKVQYLPPTISGQIWEMDPSINPGQPISQANWKMVYSDPYTVTMTIKGKTALAPRDLGYRGMSVYTEDDGTQALYVSGVGVASLGGKTMPPPALLRSTDGTNFAAVPADPGTTMGDLNLLNTIPGFLGTGGGGGGMRSQSAMTDANGVQHFLVAIGGIQGAGSIFESTNPSAGDNTFYQLTPPSMQVYDMAPFNGHLYIGVQSQGGYSVVRTDCLTPENITPPDVGCNASDFTTIVPSGACLGKKGNGGVTSMHVYTDPNGVQHLYVGSNGARASQPAELVRINTDDSWDLVMGNARTCTQNGQTVLKTPLSGYGSGFGWNYNYHMWRLNDYQGVLYVGTYNYATNFLGTSQGDGMDGYIGCNLWASPDGITFQPVTQDCFGNPYDSGVRSLLPTPYGLFLGTTNYSYGLHLFQGQVSQAAMSLTPRDVQVDTADNQGAGAVSLAWTAPGNAVSYHVYRAQVKRIHLAKAPAADPTRMDMAVDAPPAPRNVWLPGTFTEIGTTTQPYFVDHTTVHGKKYRYYIIAQDAQGNLSAHSNTAFGPTVSPVPTFGVVKAYLSNLSGNGKLSSAQADGYNQSLQAVQTKLQSGDAQGSRAQLDALRQQVAANATTGGSLSRLYNEELALLLNRLEKRLTLVNAHVLLAKHLN